MAADTPDELLKEHIALCRKERDQALRLLRDLETRGVRTWSQDPGAILVETTHERVSFLRNIVTVMDGLLARANSS